MHDAGALVERALDSNEGNAVNAAEGDSNEHSVVSRTIEHNGGHHPFVAYEAIRDALVERGIAHHEIAFIQGATTKPKREQLMAAVRSGAVRVLLAGSQNTGLNVQDRLIAVHNADVPWRPGDLEQRVGRAQRQGNAWPEIYVCNYAVEGSFDAYLWQVNHVKAQFIAQFERGDVTVREIDDIGGIVMTAAEMKALASGNPAVRRKFEVESELARLDMLRFAWSDTRRRMHGRISEIDAQSAQVREAQVMLRAAQDAVDAANTTDFQARVAATIGGEPVTLVRKRVEAGAALRDMAATVCQIHGIEQLQQHKLWGWQAVQRIVLAQYRGLLIECVVGRLAQAVVMLSLPGRGEPALIPETALAANTDRGLFDSADIIIRQFGERISASERHIAQLEAEQQTILASLDQPWQHEAAYQALAMERDALMHALAPKDEQPIDTRATDGAARPEAGVSTPDNALAPVPMVAPLVVLPALRDTQAMDAAREQIKLLDRERQVRARPSDTPTTVHHEPALILEVPGPAEEAHLQAVRDLYQPAGKLVFGNTSALAQSKRRKSNHGPPPQSSEAPEQLDLFA